MSVLVDANILVYALTEGPYREPCISVLDAIAAGSLEASTSVAVLEEVWHLELSGRVPELDGHTARSPPVFDDPLAVGPRTLDLALALTAPAELGAKDRIHVATCLEHGITTILSADRGFDAVESVAKVDPLETDLLRRLDRS